MRFLRILCAVIAANQLTAVGHPVSAQVVDSSASVKAVMRAEQAWWKGEISGDTIPMARLMAPNYESYPFGYAPVNRNDALKMIRPDTAGEHEELSNWKIRDYGATVVVTVEYRVTQGGETRAWTVVDVWSRERSTWKLAFSTSARLSPPDSTK